MNIVILGKRCLVDSNVLISAFSKEDITASLVYYLIHSRTIVLSPVVIGEFLSKSTPVADSVFNRVIKIAEIIDIDVTIAKRAGRYRKAIARKTNRTYLMDCMLAATVNLHNLVLITSNINDFPMKDITVITPDKCKF